MRQSHSDDAFAPEEAAAIAHVATIVKKTVRQLQRVTWAARELWLGSKWPVTEKDVTKMVLKSLRKDGALAVSESRGGAAGVTMGVFEKNGAPWAGVWVFTHRRKGKLRKEIVRQAERGELPHMWRRAEGGPWALSIESALREIDASAPSVSDWGIARMSELARAGVLELISRLANDDPDEASSRP